MGGEIGIMCVALVISGIMYSVLQVVCQSNQE